MLGILSSRLALLPSCETEVCTHPWPPATEEGASQVQLQLLSCNGNSGCCDPGMWPEKANLKQAFSFLMWLYSEGLQSGAAEEVLERREDMKFSGEALFFEGLAPKHYCCLVDFSSWLKDIKAERD